MKRRYDRMFGLPIAEPGEPRVLFRFVAKRGWTQANIPVAASEVSLEDLIEANPYDALERECALDETRRLTRGVSDQEKCFPAS